MRSLVFLLLVSVASAKTFTKCEWAKVLEAENMDGYEGVSLADWVCLSEHESNFNTTAVSPPNTDGSTDYGIFQINSYWWCDDGGPTKNGCNINCSELLKDDVTAAIKCAKRVVRDPKGIKAWYGWRKNCENKNLSCGYLNKC